MNKKIFLCAIANISSGSCNEDCAFCTQAVRYKADIARYHHKPVDAIVEEARAAKANGAHGVCLVTAGKGLDEKKLAFVIAACRAVKSEVSDLLLIACNGTATLDQLKTLKAAGIDAYNHNLETSRSTTRKSAQPTAGTSAWKPAAPSKRRGWPLLRAGSSAWVKATTTESRYWRPSPRWSRCRYR
jgi:biotin synthase-like enzyme